jgi:LysR family hydrogen peroxide-inducible transcriptional activator
MPLHTPALQDLSIRQLQYIVAVADTLGFHRAAERCAVSQPTLSAQVQQVEEVLGVVLFERDKRRVLVTAAGRVVVERARRVLLDMGDLLAAAARERDPLAGTFRFGVIPTVAPYLLPEVTSAWSTGFPALQVVWREEQTASLVRALDAGELDAGLLAAGPDIDGLETAVVTVDPFVLALPRGHALGAKAAIALDDLESVPVLLLDDGHCLRTQALALCARAGAREAGFRATSLSTLAQMVSTGAGVTLLPAMAASVENRRGQLDLRPFRAPAPSRTVVLAWRPASPYRSTFEVLAATLRDTLAGGGAAGDPTQVRASSPRVRASSRHQPRAASKAPGVRR